jgi:ethanolamine transporter EutH
MNPAVHFENGELLPVLRRAAAVWLLIIFAETLHGIVRRLLLEPLVGDLRARQIGVVVGSVIVFAIAFVFVRWLKGSRPVDYLAAGLLWVLCTVAFEIVLGRLMMQASWERIISDYDVAGGGLMLFGLLVMFLSPVAAAKLTDEI